LALRHWVTAARPKTLTIAVVPVLAGSTLGGVDGGMLNWLVLVVAALAAVLIQAGTNLHNDAGDFLRGADDRNSRVGPPRVTAEGWLSPLEVRAGAGLCFGGALVAGSYLVNVGGWPILVAGVVAILTGIAYTAGPRPIAYGAGGELFVWFFFGLVAVGGSYYLQTGAVSQSALMVGAMLGMPAAAVLVVNNYRDLDGDRRVGKRTLAVRIGRHASRAEYAVLMLAPFLLLIALALLRSLDWFVVLPFLTLPWALALVRRFFSEAPGPAFNPLLAATARYQLGFGLLLCFGLVGGFAPGPGV
jgi:1,4-dihydroxy-2-naphthoate octaprenyltransferase